MQRMDIKRAFQIFDLDSKSSPEAIKQRYHDLAAVWHPDLHATNSRLQELASEKMKEINSAYETIRLHLENQITITCHHCGSENRRRAELMSDYAACRACGKQLRKPSAQKHKKPCGNPRCAGTIGSNGRCDYCGKSVAEGEALAASCARNRDDSRVPEAFTRNRSRIRAFVRKTMLGSGVLLLLGLSVYAYLKTTSKENIPAIRSLESAAGLTSGPVIPSPAAPPKSWISKSSVRSAPTDDSYYRALFKTHEVKKEDAFKLQQILRTLGYSVEKPNGRISDKTESGMKRYCMDLGYTPQENFPQCFFQNSYFHYRVALEHRDWLEIYLTQDLEKWIQEQPDDERKRISGLALDQPGPVIQLVRRYKFEKFKPLPVHWPETGVIRKNFSDANGLLKIKTRTENNHYYIKLISLHTRQEILSAFIRSGSVLSVPLPFGVYELKYAAGRNWYGSEYLFGTSANYAKLPNIIIFTKHGRPSDAIAVELIPSQYGKLTTEIISEYDF
jgi:hypothetical protein